MSFMKKEDRERVKIFNQILGTHHRTKPYDWKKPEDIIEAVTMTMAEFVDITFMDSLLSDMDDEMDEMIECYHANEWTKITTGETWDNVELQAAMETLATASDAMKDLADATEETMQDVLALLFFTAPQAVRDHFFTTGWQFDTEAVEHVIEDELAEIALGIDHDGVIEHSAQRYSQALERRIKGWRSKN